MPRGQGQKVLHFAPAAVAGAAGTAPSATVAADEVTAVQVSAEAGAEEGAEAEEGAGAAAEERAGETADADAEEQQDQQVAQRKEQRGLKQLRQTCLRLRE